MAQFGRPISDIQTTSITGTFADIDEITASDVDFLYSADNTNTIYEAGLTTTLEDPVSNTGHIFRYRVAEIDGGVLGDGAGSTATVTVSLYQGATLIASDTTRNGTSSWTSYSYTLTGTEADNITDYTNLRLYFSIVGGGGSPANRRGIGVSWGELEIPNRLPQTYDDNISLTTDNTITDTTQMDLQSSYNMTLDITTDEVSTNIIDGSISLNSNNTSNETQDMLFDINTTLEIDGIIQDTITIDISPTIILDSNSVVDDNNNSISLNSVSLNLNNTDTYIVGKEFNDNTTISGIHIIETESVLTYVYNESVSIYGNSKLEIRVSNRNPNTTPGIKPISVINVGVIKNIGKIR